jgi:hypothetical protein
LLKRCFAWRDLAQLVRMTDTGEKKLPSQNYGLF